jgi:hypothetical protein
VVLNRRQRAYNVDMEPSSRTPEGLPNICPVSAMMEQISGMNKIQQIRQLKQMSEAGMFVPVRMVQSQRHGSTRG